MPCDNVPGAGEPQICEIGGSGVLLPTGDAENSMSADVRKVLYLFLLLWCFLGVALIADIFMGAIDKITSRRTYRFDKRLQKHVTKTVWNPTVANLSLMALGSSAPEILLNVIGIFPTFLSSDLGPSTIVGSAAFNLLVIIAVCVVSVVPEIRCIRDTGVYSITAFFSLFAYIWLLFILSVHSPNVVDVWEGLLTFSFFWLLIVIAFLADKGKLPGTRKPQSGCVVMKENTHEEVAEMRAVIFQKYPDIAKDLSPEDMKELIHLEFHPGATRAQHRAHATRMMTGGKRLLAQASQTNNSKEKVLGKVRSSVDNKRASIGSEPPTLGFKEVHYTILEQIAKVDIVVQCSPVPTQEVALKYFTRDGTAKSNVDYKPTQGEIKFSAGEGEKKITTEIIPSPKKQKETQCYYMDLQAIGDDCVLASQARTAEIVVIDQDKAGFLRFSEEQITVEPNATKVEFLVMRVRGQTGEVSCKWRTEEDSAKEEKDFVADSGEIKFADSVTSMPLSVELTPAGIYEQEERFRIILEEVEGGAEFDDTTDGGKETCILTITIKSTDEKEKGHIGLVAQAMRLNMDELEVGSANWKAQFMGALFVNGSREGQKGASKFAWILHIATFPWKLAFAIVPPPAFAGGWACFWVALFMIGLVTVLIGDLAELLGCVLGISPATTAITLVALGTSLPDTFASRTAALMDPYADNSIGNVTGSNSVNVFLGLGLPWTIASIYWSFVAECEPGDKWSNKFPAQAAAHPSGIFVVEAKGLSTSVLVFTCCGAACIACLYLRRLTFKGELGGSKATAIPTACFFVLLWVTYIVVSILSE